MTKTKLLQTLENELEENYQKAKAEKYNAKIYKSLLNKNKNDPLATIETILNKEYREIDGPLEGFKRLVKMKHIEWTMEYTIYKKCYRNLLTEQQKVVVVTLLHQYGGMKFIDIDKIS